MFGVLKKLFRGEVLNFRWAIVLGGGFKDLAVLGLTWGNDSII